MYGQKSLLLIVYIHYFRIWNRDLLTMASNIEAAKTLIGLGDDIANQQTNTEMGH